jgi:hypothetical protein
MSASYAYEGEVYDLEAAIAAVAADMHLDEWDDGPTGNWPDMERGLRTFDSEDDEALERADPRSTKVMALTKHCKAWCSSRRTSVKMPGREDARGGQGAKLSFVSPLPASAPGQRPSGCWHLRGGSLPTFGLSNLEARWPNDC